MRQTMKRLGVQAMVVGSMCGCGDDTTTLQAPEAWEGAEPHLVVVGDVQGERVSFELRDGEASDDVLFCERNYIVPDLADDTTWDEGYLEKIELKWRVTVNGTEREYQVELLAHDFGGSADGASITVVPYDEDDAERLATRVMSAIDWEYEENGNEVEVGATADSGTFVRHLLTGTAVTGVVVPDGEGAIGGFLHLELETGEEISLSFTANCGDNDLDIP